MGMFQSFQTVAERVVGDDWVVRASFYNFVHTARRTGFLKPGSSDAIKQMCIADVVGKAGPQALQLLATLTLDEPEFGRLLLLMEEHYATDIPRTSLPAIMEYFKALSAETRDSFKTSLFRSLRFKDPTGVTKIRSSWWSTLLSTILSSNQPSLSGVDAEVLKALLFDSEYELFEDIFKSFGATLFSIGIFEIELVNFLGNKSAPMDRRAALIQWAPAEIATGYPDLLKELLPYIQSEDFKSRIVQILLQSTAHRETEALITELFKDMVHHPNTLRLNIAKHANLSSDLRREILAAVLSGYSKEPAVICRTANILLETGIAPMELADFLDFGTIRFLGENMSSEKYFPFLLLHALALEHGISIQVKTRAVDDIEDLLREAAESTDRSVGLAVVLCSILLNIVENNNEAVDFTPLKTHLARLPDGCLASLAKALEKRCMLDEWIQEYIQTLPVPISLLESHLKSSIVSILYPLTLEADSPLTELTTWTEFEHLQSFAPLIHFLPLSDFEGGLGLFVTLSAFLRILLLEDDIHNRKSFSHERILSWVGILSGRLASSTSEALVYIQQKQGLYWIGLQDLSVDLDSLPICALGFVGVLSVPPIVVEKDLTWIDAEKLIITSDFLSKDVVYQIFPIVPQFEKTPCMVYVLASLLLHASKVALRDEYWQNYIWIVRRVTDVIFESPEGVLVHYKASVNYLKALLSLYKFESFKDVVKIEKLWNLLKVLSTDHRLPMLENRLCILLAQLLKILPVTSLEISDESLLESIELSHELPLCLLARDFLLRRCDQVLEHARLLLQKLTSDKTDNEVKLGQVFPWEKLLNLLMTSDISAKLIGFDIFLSLAEGSVCSSCRILICYCL